MLNSSKFVNFIVGIRGTRHLVSIPNKIIDNIRYPVSSQEKEPIFNNGIMKHVDVHPDVRKCLDLKKPVVALESTIITHGMPYPQNLETALQVEGLVSEYGALPATIAILDGRIKVGLTEQELRRLSAMKASDVIKCSRRDLAYVVAENLSGGTTVAATMIVANMIGMRVFATGGIGGVHRGGQDTLDISADLVELGRTPIAVVCSGVKSILDIPRTLEFLETQGVCVTTYGNANGCFPDFYTRDSGCKAPYNVDGPKQAARLIETLHDLKLKSGIIIAVPIPEEYAVRKTAIDAAIEEAHLEAQNDEISGKEMTPYLLSAIAKITMGNSLQANMALIKNNASVAAQIARQLSGSVSKYYFEKNKKILPKPLIVGASILDVSLTMLDDLPQNLDGSTYQTKTKQSAGGVGRNLAEGIFKLHGDANFISVVGDDQVGQSLLKLMPSPLQEGVHIDKQNPTSLCSVVFDKTGDCKLILGNMDIHNSITPERVLKEKHVLCAAPLIIIDGNLSLPTIECILDLACKHQRAVFFEPTDRHIAGKPFKLSAALTKQIKMISPNLQELKTIVETITKRPVSCSPRETDSINKILRETKKMLKEIEEHFDCVVVTLGKHGVLLCLRGEFDKPLFDIEKREYIEQSKTQQSRGNSLRFYEAKKVANLANVSGAGDSFSSGFITGMLRGYEPDRCVGMGFIAAERALSSESAVPERYFNDENEEMKQLQATIDCLVKEDL